MSATYATITEPYVPFSEINEGLVQPTEPFIQDFEWFSTLTTAEKALLYSFHERMSALEAGSFEYETAGRITDLADQGMRAEQELHNYVESFVTETKPSVMMDVLCLVTKAYLVETDKDTNSALNKLQYIYFLVLESLDQRINQADNPELASIELQNVLLLLNFLKDKNLRKVFDLSNGENLRKYKGPKGRLVAALLLSALLAACIAKPSQQPVKECPLITDPLKGDPDQIIYATSVTNNISRLLNGREGVEIYKGNDGFVIRKYPNVWSSLDQSTRNRLSTNATDIDISSERWSVEPTYVNYCVTGDQLIQFMVTPDWRFGDFITLEVVDNNGNKAIHPVAVVGREINGSDADHFLRFFNN